MTARADCTEFTDGAIDIDGIEASVWDQRERRCSTWAGYSDLTLLSTAGFHSIG